MPGSRSSRASCSAGGCRLRRAGGSAASTTPTLAAGIAGTVVTGVLILLVGGSWAVIAVTAGTIVTRVAPSRLRGEALGVYAAMTVLAGGVGSIAGGALAGPLGFPAAFGLAGVVILAGAGLVLALRGIFARTGAAATDAESPG